MKLKRYFKKTKKKLSKLNIPESDELLRCLAHFCFLQENVKKYSQENYKQEFPLEKYYFEQTEKVVILSCDRVVNRIEMFDFFAFNQKPLASNDADYMRNKKHTEESRIEIKRLIEDMQDVVYKYSVFLDDIPRLKVFKNENLPALDELSDALRKLDSTFKEPDVVIEEGKKIYVVK